MPFSRSLSAKRTRLRRLLFQSLESRQLLAGDAVADLQPITVTETFDARTAGGVVSNQARIINGTPTSGFPSVGIVGEVGFGGYCTGTLIAPQYVLSAAHCAIDVPNANGLVTFGSTTYATSRVILHPDYDDFNFGTDLTNDIAIYELTQPVAGITPSPIFRSTPTVGTTLTLVGFGAGGTGNSGEDGTFGTKRVGTTTIDRVSSTLIHWNFDNNNESNTAPGDSGGPAFIQVGEQFFVAGVTSGGSNDDAGLGDESFDTRVDVYQDWIDGILNPVVTTNFIDYTTAGSTYTQSFNTLASSGLSSSLPSGWVIEESGSNANDTYGTSDGSSGTGDTYSFGSSGSSDRALGSLRSGSLTPTFGAAIQNNSGANLTSMSIGYRGEQWRRGTTSRSDQFDFQYSLNASDLNGGSWIDVNSLDYATDSGASVGALDGNAAANSDDLFATIGGLDIPVGATFWIRWVDSNASGADDGMAIDDFVFSAVGGTVTNSPPTISSIDNQITPFQTATVAIPFTVADVETSASLLAVTATSSNPGLVPNASITIGGSGEDRTVTLTPAAGQSGLTTITLNVSDGESTTSTTFDLTVNANVGPTTNSVLRIVSYNIAAASGDGTPRSNYETVLQAIGVEEVGGVQRQVDVFALQEVLSQATSSTIIAAALNNLYGTTDYATGFLNGGTSGAGTQGVVYNSTTVTLINEALIGVVDSNGAPRQTVRHDFRPVGTSGESDFYIYNSHLKASDSGPDRTRRFIDVQAIRDDADALGQGAHIIYAGDFNMFTSNEPGYQEFLSSGNGQAFDPIDRPGNWSDNNAFRDIFTQAPSATSQPALGLDGGGMDDRLDFQLISGELRDGVGLDYRPGSYRTFGVDGSVAVNGSIDDASSTALPGLANRLQVLGLLRTVSDHLPVVADYVLPLAANNPPTSLALSNDVVDENQPAGTLVGLLTTTDADGDDAFTYSLVDGAGDDDNASFTIVDNSLRTSASFDFETDNEMTVRVRTTDQGGLSVEQSFTIAVGNVNDAVVVERLVFYNDSFWDGFDEAAGVADDNAIATDKEALLPGQTATFANTTSYTRGINGLFVDISHVAQPTLLSPADFELRIGNGSSLEDFATFDVSPIIDVRADAGVGGADRVSLILPSGSVVGTWLQVIVAANANTGLAQRDAFYFGNAVGNVGNDATFAVGNADIGLMRRNRSNPLNPPTITNVYDINRDGSVGNADVGLASRVRTNPLTELSVIIAPNPLIGRTSAALVAINVNDRRSARTAFSSVSVQDRDVDEDALNTNLF